MNPPEPEIDAAEIRCSVLCIEDEPVDQLLVEAQLAHFPNVRLLKASRGKEGIQLALAERPDLILLDMHLPDMGGLEVVRALNTQISEGLYRVILLTGDNFSLDIVKAMSLGAHEYWLKPLKFETLRNDLPRVVRAARSDRLRSRAR